MSPYASRAVGLATDPTVGVNLSLAAALSPPPELYPSLPNCCGRGVIFFLNLLGADERAWDPFRSEVMKKAKGEGERQKKHGC